MIRHSLGLLALTSAALLLSACQETDLPPNQPPQQGSTAVRPETAPQTRPTASLEILAPAPEAVLAVTEPVSLRYRVGQLPPGAHVNAYLNGTLLAMLEQTEGEYRIGKLAAGSYTLSLDLRDAKDKPLGVSRSSNFSIGSAAAKAVRILSPSDGAIHKSDVPLTFSYEFTPRTTGDHVHAFLDDRLLIMLKEPKGTYTLPGVTPGKHAIKIDLRNADHEALGPVDSIQITVLNPL